MRSPPVRAVSGVIFVVRVEQEAALCDAIRVAMGMRHRDNGETHLSRPRVHDLAHVVPVAHCLEDNITLYYTI